MDHIATIVAIAFWFLLLSGGVLIALSGNRPAQRFLGAILGAALFTAVTDMFLPKALAAYAYFVVDGTLLVIAVYYVLQLEDYWPIWFAGFHSIAVAGQIARLAYSGPLPSIYVDLAGFWSVPAVLTMVIGVYMDGRFRQSQLQGRDTQFAGS